ncbi:MAG: GNAT family N-acetyltransferase [Lachnospiraceae bacterium]|nr:GNAT family N-acetyltransferase [Lachnospiraceae bacterium]MDD3797271.1 GNAT family N-acetyltransferase [Lachnospiraceae bacterium]
MEAELEKYIQISDSRYILQHIQDIHNLLQQSYWANSRDADTIRASIENSCCFAIVDKNIDTIVAFARVITDFATMYYLTDVIVDEQYRKIGLGKKLIKWITEQEPRLKNQYGLLLTKDAQDLYSRYGFCDYADHCMCKF